ICFPLIISLILYYWNFLITFSKHKIITKHQNVLFKLKVAITFLVITAILISLIILWSKSRQAQLLYLSELFIGFLFLSNRTIKSVAVVLGIALFFSIYFASNEMGWLTTASRQLIPPEIWERFSSLHQQSFRLDVFQCAISRIKDDPLLGLGIGSFAIECENELGFFINHAHNIILQVISDVGIPLGLVFGYMKVFYWRKSYQNLIKQIKFKADISIWLVIGFLIAAINTIILSLVSLSVFQSYRLLFLYGITLLIPYTFSYTKTPSRRRELR
ncbi:MAG: O-antigen ligase family protein, partial [Halothece sp. Uz-M2-17]|nr:O-antigen ligase family protein [Halothece sp. Uz-M2-17]